MYMRRKTFYYLLCVQFDFNKLFCDNKYNVKFHGKIATFFMFFFVFVSLFFHIKNDFFLFVACFSSLTNKDVDKKDFSFLHEKKSFYCEFIFMKKKKKKEEKKERNKKFFCM